MTDIEAVKNILFRVRDEISHPEAVKIINEIGRASRIGEIAEELYEEVIRHAEHLLNHRHHNPEILTGRLTWAADLLRRRWNALERSKGQFMSAMDDLKTAVDSSVAEMERAATFIRNHPAAANDPQLADFATRLQNAANALGGVDVEAVAQPGTVDAGGTVTSAGTAG